MAKPATHYIVTYEEIEALWKERDTLRQENESLYEEISKLKAVLWEIKGYCEGVLENSVSGPVNVVAMSVSDMITRDLLEKKRN